jgi:hypothetical protein
MSQALEPDLAIPKPQTARIFGVLNIIFAIILLYFVYVTALMFLFAPVGAGLFRLWMGNLQQAIEKEQTIDRLVLQRLANEAATEESRARFSQQLAAKQAQPIPNLEFASMGMDQLENPTIRGYSFTELAISLPVNGLLLLSGLGLVRLRDWGRRLALWVSGVKVVWLLASTIVAVAIIFPIQSQLVMKQFEAQMQFQAGLTGGRGPVGFNPQQLSWMVGISSTGSALVGFVLAAAYPVLSLWMLTRPGVRAACQSSDSETSGAGPWL